MSVAVLCVFTVRKKPGKFDLIQEDDDEVLPNTEDTGLKVKCLLSYVLSYVYSKQPIFGLTQAWLRELSFSRLECGVHDRLHISSADWWDLLLPLA